MKKQAGKYDHINFVPPKSVADAAARGLELRQKAKKSHKGGLTPAQAKKEGVGSGVQRAVNLKNRNKLSPETVRRMLRFFTRHAKNAKIDAGKTPLTDKGYQAHLIWGGNPGYAWARKIVRQMDAADENAKKKSRAALLPVFEELCKVATELDGLGLTKLASQLDALGDDLHLFVQASADQDDGELTAAQAQEIATGLEIPAKLNWRFFKGLEVEWREHGKHIPPHEVGLIVLDHLSEDINYYEKEETDG